MRLVRIAVNAEQLLYRSPGGVGRYTAQLLTVLPGLFPDDEVVPYTARHSTASIASAFRRTGVDPLTAGRTVVLRWPRPILYEGWLSVGWPQLPVLHGAELVHAPSVAVPPHPGVPLVVTVYDVAPALFPESFPARGRRFHRQGMAAAGRRADLVLTLSEAAAAEIAQHSTIPSDRIRVVPHGVADVEVDPAVRHAVLTGRGLAGRPYVLWVGSLEPRKGVGTLVAAMATLRRRHRSPGIGAPPMSEVQLVLAGYPGWLNRDLLPADDAAVLGSDIHQLGVVDDNELWSLYSGATVFAFPSRHEGFGLPVLEAMSQGTAVLASDIAAIREVAGGAARLVAPDDVEAWADALEDLLGNETARRRLAAAGRERARRFELATTITAIQAVYRELLGR
jgi:glycosyltransferase involved in cell wall biosynthesis